MERKRREQKSKGGYRDKFINEADKDKEMPEWACAVCIKMLYMEERYPLAVEDIATIEEGIGGPKNWPIMSYLSSNVTQTEKVYRRSDGGMHACKTHSSSGEKGIKSTIEFINFVNLNWCFPGIQDESMVGLHPSAEGFLSPVIVFCELTNSRNRLTRATRAGHHFVTGRIGLYESKDYLGAHVGTRGMSKLMSSEVSLGMNEVERVLLAWDWLKENNPLFKGIGLEGISGVLNVRETITIEEFEPNGRVNENVSAIQGFHMMPVDGGGPKAADEINDIKELPIGLLGKDQKMVTYSNPCLLGYLFPTLYPLGRGYYSLNYDGIPKGPPIEFLEEIEEKQLLFDDNTYNENKDENGGGNEEVDTDSDISLQLDSEDELKSKGGKRTRKKTDGGKESRYSQFTLKSYAKFRLMGFDRRFARNIKYILMLFDWIQKQTVFGTQMRMASPTTKGKPTTAGNVLERRNNGLGTKYCESTTVPIPASIRTGAKYKRALYIKFSALFEEYRTPQLFGTYTCDAESEGQRTLARFLGGPESKTHDDPVMFTVHWKRQWKRFFGYLTGDWAKKRVGGLIAWCWVFEMQDRGTPHTHFCLWTNHTVEQMIANDIISCSSQFETEAEMELVRKHQVHRSPCGRYCKPNDEKNCRFGFPKSVNREATYYDEKVGRYVLHRMEGDEWIVGYNLELLKFGRVNMDLQYNTGSQAKKYMCKYISKQAGTKKATVVQGGNDSKESEAYVHHFHFRSVGVVEAIMDVCGFSMHGVSHKDIYLPTDLPENRKRVLKRKKDIEAGRYDSTDIFLDDKWTKYLKRPQSVPDGPDFDEMTYSYFYKHFNYVANVKHYIDMRGRKVSMRQVGKEFLVRTRTINATKSEDAFMHLLMMYYPWREDVDTWIGEGTEYLTFQDLAVAKLGRDFIQSKAPGLIVILDYGPIVPVEEKERYFEEIKVDYEWTEDQQAVIREVMIGGRGCRLLVTGAAGTGKSAVLKKLCRVVSKKGFSPVKLAPSGVAAVNIGGDTIHRWFGVTKMGGSNGYPLCNSHSIRERLMDMKDGGKRPFFFIDEISMVSGTLLSVMSKALQEASLERDHDEVFGGYPVVFFGDFGQLAPINKKSKIIDWVWKSEVYKSLQRMDLVESCRQKSDREFKDMLDAVRCGDLTVKACEVLIEIIEASESCSMPSSAVHLMPHKETVTKMNDNKLRQLHGELWTNLAQDDTGYSTDDMRSKGIEAETGLLTKLSLKVGARVMCTSNVDVAGGLVNGTIATVGTIYGHEVVEVITEDKKLFRICQEHRSTTTGGHERRQFPLVLAWALTIHKSQSLTLDNVVVHLRESFTSGQAYVAMSRVRSRENLFISGISVQSLIDVCHAVKSRLTKEREIARNDSDVRIELIEEGQMEEEPRAIQSENDNLDGLVSDSDEDVLEDRNDGYNSHEENYSDTRQPTKHIRLDQAIEIERLSFGTARKRRRDEEEMEDDEGNGSEDSEIFSRIAKRRKKHPFI